MAADDEGPGGGGRVLGDLPPSLWGALLRAVRRAVEDVPRSRLPRALQPFAGWHPEGLRFGRARRAVAAALADDPDLRERVAARIEPQSVVADAEEVEPVRLAERYGADAAVAALVAAARWADVALLASRVMDDAAADANVAAEDSRSARAPSGRRRPGRGEAVDGEVRHEQERARRLREDAGRQRRRAERAEERAAKAERRAAELAAEVAELRASTDRLEGAMAAQRRRDRSRISRLKEDLRRAESRSAVDPSSVTEIADELIRLAETLRPQGVDPGPLDRPAAAAPDEREHGSTEAAGVAVPREPPAATPGRPCVLPPGLSATSTAGVRSLLRAAGVRLVLDGYNVSMDPAGRPAQALGDQRRWLTSLAASVCARFGAPVTVVFDGHGIKHPDGAAARGVLVVFTDEAETADDWIVGLVEDADEGSPVIVVTSDRDLGERVATLGADVVPSGRFLGAVEA